MADIKKLIPYLLKWEGGYVNDPADAGGATNMGVTIGTWRTMGYDKTGDHAITVEDIKALTKEDFAFVAKVGFWDRWKADSIQDQQVANILVDWLWGSGYWGIVIPQRLLGVKADGLVGIATITAVNAQNPETFHGLVYKARVDFLNDIVLKSMKRLDASMTAVSNNNYPSGKSKEEWNGIYKLYKADKTKAYMTWSNKRFEVGWMNRLKDFKWKTV